MPISADSPGNTAPTRPVLEIFGKDLSVALQYAIISLLAFLISYYSVSAIQKESSSLQMTGTMWAMISGIIVLQETRQSTLDTASRRIFASFIGAVLSFVYLLFFPFSPVGMAVMIGITILLCMSLKIRDHAKLAALTVGVIMIFSTISPDQSPFVNASLRFGEVIVGSVVAVTIEWIWPYLEGIIKHNKNPV
jgi:uncharacterized membrane protein YgaE (UPF0421/DUF939 family)